MSEKNVLLIDNTPKELETMKEILSKEFAGKDEIKIYLENGPVGNEESFYKNIFKFDWDLVVIDVRLTDHNNDYDFSGIDVMKRILEKNSNTKVILISNFSNSITQDGVPLEIRCLEEGAFTFIPRDSVLSNWTHFFKSATKIALSNHNYA